MVTVILNNADDVDNDNYAAAGKDQRPVWPLLPLPRTAFAFLLTPDRPHAILSALLCLVQRSSLTIPRPLASSMPGVQH